MSELEKGEAVSELQQMFNRVCEDKAALEAERDQAIRERNEVRAKLSAVERQRDALSASIKQTCGSDGSCENCGCVPSMHMPFQLCDECKDIGLAGRDALSAELEQARELLREMRDAVKDAPCMQGRQYVSLGVAVNRFLDSAPSEAQRESQEEL
jgi:hypothetical protein